MEKSDGDELFKDYFETFNSEAAPACEDSNEDPLAGFGSDLNLECLGSTNPDDLLNPLSSLVSDSDFLAIPESGQQEAGSADHQYGQLCLDQQPLESQPAFIDPHDAPNQDILPTQDDIVIKQELPEPYSASPAPAPGLRIAGFAMDPDLCSVLQPSLQDTENIAQSRQDLPELENIPDNSSAWQSSPQIDQSTSNQSYPSSFKEILRFPFHRIQLRKVYQLCGRERDTGFVILSSNRMSTNSKSDWKLFFPKESPILKRDFSQSFTITGSSDGNNWQFKSENGNNFFFLDLVKTWEELERRHHAFLVNVKDFMIAGSNMVMDAHGKMDIRHFFKEAPNVIFTSKLYGVDTRNTFSNLGEEFVKAFPQSNQRKNQVNSIFQFLLGLYPNQDSKNVFYTALLFESDLWNQFHVIEEIEKNLEQALINFSYRVSQSTEYAYLKRYPHIQYLALTKAHIRINLTVPATGVTTGGPVMTTSNPQLSRPRVNAPRQQFPQRPGIPPNVSLGGQRFSHSPSNDPQAPGYTFLRKQLQPGRAGILMRTLRPMSPAKAAATSIIRSIRAPLPLQPQPGPSHQTQQTPIIVSVSSMASSASSSLMAPASLSSAPLASAKFVCPLPAAKCPDQREKDRDGLINHLTLGHYSTKIADMMTNMQQKNGLSANECPFPDCGYIGHSSQDLVLHYGYAHNASVQALQRENINLKSLLDKGFQFLNHQDKERSMCKICRKTVSSKHLVQHMALVHLKDQYMAEMKEEPTWSSARAHSLCPNPQCNYQYGIGLPPTEAVAKTRDILLIKHYASVHSHPYKKCGGLTQSSPETNNQNVSAHRNKSSGRPWRVPETQKMSSDLDLDFANKVMNMMQPKDKSSIVESSLDCKYCKKTMAKMINGNLEGLGGRGVVKSLSNHVKHCWVNGKLTCRVCNSLVDVNNIENIKQHFDMDEHKEKTKMFNLLKDVYCKARGFSVNDGFIASNYKFFILALKAYALHHEGMTVSNCLSMLMSILDISQKQYKELYKHVDMLAKEHTPNYLCYCCNYAEYGRISDLSRHTQGTEHRLALARLSRDNMTVVNTSEEFLFCSKCGQFFTSESIMDHADHIIQVTQEADIEDDGNSDGEGQSPAHKKRRLMSDIESEHDGDIGAEHIGDAVSNGTGSKAGVEDPNFEPQSENVEEAEDDEEFIVDDDEFASNPSEKEEKEPPRSENDSSSTKVTDDDNGNCMVSDAENQNLESDPDLSDVEYYYFCLDCEEESSSGFRVPEDLVPNNPKFPLSMDIAKHISAKNHQNFVPIRKKFSINIQNLSFNPNYHKTVIKRWKNLVKDGEIAEVAYSHPRVCRKCNIAMNDAVDMFKHIRDVHIKPLGTN